MGRPEKPEKRHEVYPGENTGRREMHDAWTAYLSDPKTVEMVAGMLFRFQNADGYPYQSLLYNEAHEYKEKAQAILRSIAGESDG